MTLEGKRALIRAVAVILLATAAFFAFQQPVRELEAAAATFLLRLAGADAVSTIGGGGIAVFPSGHEPFAAIVTASCSSLPALLALAALGSVTSIGSRRRQVAAVGAALAVVFVGNVLRIAGSVALGLAAGSSSLVLFHDSVGSVFTFAYALGGYVLMLAFQLPRRQSAISHEARAVAG